MIFIGFCYLLLSNPIIQLSQPKLASAPHTNSLLASGLASMKERHSTLNNVTFFTQSLCFPIDKNGLAVKFLFKIPSIAYALTLWLAFRGCLNAELWIPKSLNYFKKIQLIFSIQRITKNYLHLLIINVLLFTSLSRVLYSEKSN